MCYETLVVMNDYKIVTEKFEGPLDLLMHLINKEKLDIYDIPISTVTRQYLDYIFQMQEFNIEIASEFLLMAATLLQIKSRLLLPKQTVDEKKEDDLEESEQVDPRQELIDRLTVYRQFKLAGDVFADLWEINQCYYVREPIYIEKNLSLPVNLSINDLLLAISQLLENIEQIDEYVFLDDFNVKDKVQDILSLLKEQKRITLKQTLTRSGTNGELIAAFLAVLELLKMGKITINQPEKLGEIYIYSSEE